MGFKLAMMSERVGACSLLMAVVKSPLVVDGGGREQASGSPPLVYAVVSRRATVHRYPSMPYVVVGNGSPSLTSLESSEADSVSTPSAHVVVESEGAMVGTPISCHWVFRSRGCHASLPLSTSADHLSSTTTTTLDADRKMPNHGIGLTSSLGSTAIAAQATIAAQWHIEHTKGWWERQGGNGKGGEHHENAVLSMLRHDELRCTQAQSFSKMKGVQASLGVNGSIGRVGKRGTEIREQIEGGFKEPLEINAGPRQGITTPPIPLHYVNPSHKDRMYPTASAPVLRPRTSERMVGIGGAGLGEKFSHTAKPSGHHRMAPSPTNDISTEPGLDAFVGDVGKQWTTWGCQRSLGIASKSKLRMQVKLVHFEKVLGLT
ncbi:hypothetical protein NMY22_g11030 [Coprinellus aureogranulatus]|nr:hypothetical protein NMY22_g11030 [Coprinellus aureogranulatus]